MAHKEQKEFLGKVFWIYPFMFKNCKVLDIGSLDINGNNRHLFQGNYEYTGVDIGEGNNVDVVCKGHEFDSPEPFDVVISTECFEHDKHYKDTIKNCVRLTKSGGMFVFTCATTGRPEHGTRATDIASSPLTCAIEGISDVREDNEWGFYYHNVSVQDLLDAVDIQDNFKHFAIEVRENDLYFWGIKK